MRTLTALCTALSLFALTAPAHAADDEAEVGACLRLIAQEKAPQGQRMVSSDIKTLLLMKEAIYSFTLFAGNSYEIQTCAGANVTDLDLYLYDQTGALIDKQTAVERQPKIAFKPERTGTYYVVLKLIDTNDAQPGAVGYVELYE